MARLPTNALAVVAGAGEGKPALLDSRLRGNDNGKDLCNALDRQAIIAHGNDAATVSALWQRERGDCRIGAESPRHVRNHAVSFFAPAASTHFRMAS